MKNSIVQSSVTGNIAIIKGLIMNDEKVKFIFQVVGGLLGIIAFLWNLVGYLWTYIFSHLQVDLSSEKIKIGNAEKLKVTTIVENKGTIAKKIDFAFLLIKPENESFRNSLLLIAKYQGLETEDIGTPELLGYLAKQKDRLSGKTIDNRFSIYTLPYFYDEQFQIGNEKVKYSCIIDLAELQENKVYNLRFVTISMHLFKTYLRHRSTSDVFIT
jgi:hypothetical protein